MKTIIIIIGLMFSLISDSLSAEPKNPINASPTSLPELKRAIKAVIEERKVPAVAISLLNQTGPIWVESIGQANIEKAIAAGQETLFGIGSISKMFVSLSILQLVEQGKLSLDDKIDELIPEISYLNRWQKTHPIRVVHLLEHTAGWDDLHTAELAYVPIKLPNLKQTLDFHPDTRTSRWPPGTKASYSNIYAVVAAYLVEKISGQYYQYYVQQNLFNPIGMTTASFIVFNKDPRSIATQYRASTTAVKRHLLRRIHWPAQGIIASAKDMSKLVQFFLNRGMVNGKQILSEQSLRRMETAKTNDAAGVGMNLGYGLNNYSSAYKHWQYRGHSGYIFGSLSNLFYLPQSNRGHFISLTTDDTTAAYQISQLIRAYETNHLIAPPRRNSIALSERQKDLAGYYIPTHDQNQSIYFLTRLFSAQKFRVENDKLIRQKLLGGDRETFSAVNDYLFRSDKTGQNSLALTNDSSGGNILNLRPFHGYSVDTQTFQKTSALIVYFEFSIVIIWLIILFSTMFYALIWPIRKFRGKIPGRATIQIRQWPFFASLSMTVTLIIYYFALNDITFRNFGTFTIHSFLVMVLTILFMIFSLLGLYSAIKLRHEPMNRINYWYSTVSTLVHIVVASYLYSFGVIGAQTWA